MPSWKKVIISGSNAALNSLTVSNGITGSLFGTSSWAVNAQTASFITASNVYGPFGSNSVATASYATTASFSLATTENRVLVINKSGATISKGMVVHLTGSNNSSDTPYVITASYESDSLSANTLGIASQTITFNSTGYITTEGVLTGIDVTGLVSGQLIYLGATGSITGSAPVAPLHSVRLGQVVRDSPSNNGAIYVRIDNGYELGELHDIIDRTTTSSYGDLLVKSGSVWTNSRQLTGSYGLTGSLQATSFTGSLFGTASTSTTTAAVAGTTNYVPKFTSGTTIGNSQIFDNGSQVGIGMTVPNTYFGVRANYAVSSLVDLENTNATGNAAMDLFNAGTFIGTIGTDKALGLQYDAWNTGNHFFRTFGTTRMFISGSGNIGIRTTTPTSASLHVSGNVFATSFTGSLSGTASYASQALSSSFAISSSYAEAARTVGITLQDTTPITYNVTFAGASSGNQSLNVDTTALTYNPSTSTLTVPNLAGTASWASNATTASFALTASSVTTLNQNVLITGSLTVGATTAGASENTITLGARDNGSEGGQLGLNAPGGTYTSASMIDNYNNSFRILKGTNANSTGLVAQWNLHNTQMQLPGYTSPTSMPGTVSGLLAFDTSGNIITTTTGSGGGGVTINNNTDNYIVTATGTANTLNGESGLQYNGTSLTVTGQVTASGAIISTANGAMYFRGGDDAEFWDINVANTVGIYGQQTQTEAGLKLGSSGATLYGSGSRFGINTTTPTSASLTVNGNVWATSFTGSLFGTASWANNATTATSATQTAAAVTFNNAGSGDASGTSFNGSTARTISYNTVGAPSTGGTGATGTWGIGISGNAATATSASFASTASWATNVVNNGVTSVATAGTVSGITLTGGTITSTGTITLGGSISGLTNSNLSGTAGITNANLANPSLMIGNSSIALGATGSSLTGLTSVTSTSFTGSLFGTASWANNATTASYALTAGSTAAVSGTTNYVSKFTSGTTIGNSQIFDNGTNVGIGTTNPGSKLTLQANNNTYALELRNSVGDTRGGFFYDNTSGTNTSLLLQNSSGVDAVVLRTSGVSYLNGGNVGIGTTSPTYKFEVSDGTRTGVINPNSSLDGVYMGVTQAKPLIFGTADTERMRILAGGNVGIGTISPSNKFVVSDGGNLGLEINPNYSGESYIAVYNRGTSAYGNLNLEAANIYFRTGTSPVVRGIVDSSGNVGIGTSSPASYSGYTSLCINNASSGGLLDLQNNGTSALRLSADSTTQVSIYGATNVPMVFSTNATERMRITSAGDIAVGTTAALLNTGGRGNITVNGSAESILTLATGGTWKSYFFTNGTDTLLGAVGALILSPNSGTEAMRINTSGNVGIGTTTTSIAGTTFRTLITSGDNRVMAFNGASNSSVWWNGGGTPQFAIDSMSGGGANFWTNDGSWSERMRITSAGNVGIGTTSPSERLHVSGNGLITGTLEVDTVNNGAGDFLTRTSGGIITRRTAAEVLSDIGGQAALTNPVTGTGVNQRVALWSGTTTQTSNANLTFDGTTLAVGGNATTTGYAIIGTHAYLASGNYIYFDSGVTNDYAIRKTSTSLAFTSAGNFTFNKDVNITGTLTATVKSFIIDHPTKEGKKLQYGVLEGPEHSVYVRGKLTNSNIITLPDHWHALVHEDTITVNLTPIGKKQDLWVETVSDTTITVGSDNEINCYYTVFAERKDIEKLVTEFDK